MNVETLLTHLQGVHKTGPASWRAKCPACDHKRDAGALAISEGSDKTILLHCFRCSDTAAILAAVGLTVADLFPERIKPQTPEERRAAREAFRRSAWKSALGVIGREACIVNAAAGWLRQRKELTEDDYNRLVLACSRIDQAREVLA
ncbi:MAG TPA: hypothetical protein VN693_06485 [Rhodanobacteraceae bacterium]|nr:hypothetical protein [Rhodanobacteraceae bacterium]